MADKLKTRLEADLGTDWVNVSCVAVDSSDGKPKVYEIAINEEPLFEWAMFSKEGKMETEVKVAPKGKRRDSWTTPLNFETHEGYFGPGATTPGGEVKDEMYEDLKQAILAKAA